MLESPVSRVRSGWRWQWRVGCGS